MGNIKIGHASTDGAPAAQQVKIADWYSHPWGCVIRANDSNVANKIADCMIKACNNDVILYSQARRTTLENQVKSKGYDPSKATSTCYCDCSSLVSLCCKYAGVDCGIFATSAEESCLVGSGKFKRVGTSPGANFNYSRGDILLTAGSHTAVVVSIDGKVDSSGSSGSTGKKYDFPKYKLTQDQLRNIAIVCKSEDSSLAGAKAVACVFANRWETRNMLKKDYKNICQYIISSDLRSDIKHIFSNTSGSGILSRIASEVKSTAKAINVDTNLLNGIKDVLVNGKRTMPLFIDEFNSFDEIRSIKNGQKVEKSVKDRSSYVQDKTIITNNKGTNYRFWSFPSAGSGPFGYTNDGLRQEWDQYINTSGTPGGGGGSGGGIPGVDWTKLNPYIVYLDRSSATKLNYADLMANHGVIGGMIEVGQGTKYEKFRSNKYYDQVRGMEEVKLPYGYVMKSVAKNEREADEEIQNLAFLVRKYPPMFGFWVEFGMANSKAINDKIMKIYYRELIRLGLKNKIGIRCTRDQMKKITWLDFQEDWYLWLIEHVKKIEDIQCLLDPEFFDTDGKSGPIRGANGSIFNYGSSSSGSSTISNGGTVGPTKEEVAACLYAILHEWGIPDVNICGLLGCYDDENGINVAGIEGDYKYFPGQAYKWTEDKQKALDNITPYTKKVMALHHTNSSFYYCKEDGNWWVGIGMTSATGVLAYKLVQFSKKVGLGWYTVECTAAYMLAKGSEGGFSSTNWLRGWTKPESSAAAATQKYHSTYEMPGRQARAQRISKGVYWWNHLSDLKKRAEKYKANAVAVVNYVKGGCKGKLSV